MYKELNTPGISSIELRWWSFAYAGVPDVLVVEEKRRAEGGRRRYASYRSRIRLLLQHPKHIIPLQLL
jgi:hypothetical protein